MDGFNPSFCGMRHTLYSTIVVEANWLHICVYLRCPADGCLTFRGQVWYQHRRDEGLVWTGPRNSDRGWTQQPALRAVAPPHATVANAAYIEKQGHDLPIKPLTQHAFSELTATALAAAASNPEGGCALGDWLVGLACVSAYPPRPLKRLVPRSVVLY